MNRILVDESNDHQEPFYAIISKHLRLLADYLISIDQHRPRNHAQLAELLHRVQTFCSQPGILAAIILLLSALLLVHTSHYWMHTFARRLPFKMISKRILTTASSSSNGRNSNSNAGKLKCEMRTKNAGLFAMQGRRPRMEDRLSLYLPKSSDVGTNPLKRLLVSTLMSGADDCSASISKCTPIVESNSVMVNVEMFAIHDGHGGVVS